MRPPKCIGWDYTIYDAATRKQLDGGQLDAPELPLSTAALKICEMHDLGGQTIHPTQVSTRVDYGVYLQFFARRGASEVPLCAAEPHILQITGLHREDVVGIHTYCRDDTFEIIDARYLARLPQPPRPPAQGE